MPLGCPVCFTDLEGHCQIPSKPKIPTARVLQNSNGTISSIEIDLLRQTISSAVKVKGELDERISNLITLLVKCQVASSEYDAFLAQYRPLLSSIRRLPSEILTECFHFAVEAEKVGGNIFHMSPTLAPMNISQVCRYWRDLTLQTPTLWSRIEITVDKVLPLSKLHHIHSSLIRARNSPLEVILHLNQPYRALSDLTKSTIRLLLQMLIARAAYWRIADFSLPTELLDDSEFFPISDCPKLEELYIFTQECVSHLEWTSTNPAFVAQAPILDRVQCHNFSVPVERFQSIVPWHSLTMAYFDPGSLAFTTLHLLHVLQSCPRLQYLAIPGEFDDFGQEVTHNSLASLILQCPGPACLARLELPHLNHVKFSSLRKASTDPAHIAAFILRCPSLRYVAFQECEEIPLSEMFPRSKLAIEVLEVVISNIEQSVQIGRDVAAISKLRLPKLKAVTVTLQPSKKGFSVPIVDGIQALALQLTSRNPMPSLSLVVHKDLPKMCTFSAEAIDNLEELDWNGLVIRYAEARTEWLH
ncbi:hypothetical protein DL96DRAFT_1600624 [Flagelloscypha sp. PMI_526]|nr:hypothetical protein DL96DRAFT_1600624 [Flagelloscypha sp. PMI_526]